MNGTADPYAARQPSTPAPSSPLMHDATVIKIDLGLTGKQIIAGITALAALIGSGATAGWIFLPAKDRDVQDLRAVVQVMREEQKENRESVGRLTVAVDNLAGIVDRLQQAPPKVIERTIVRPPAARSARPAATPR